MEVMVTYGLVPQKILYTREFKPVISADIALECPKIGPTPPIKTDKGWLDIIHGVFSPAGGTPYYIGAILLDLEQP